MASGLQTWSQTAASNSNADSSVNWAEGQAPSTVNDSARALMASAAKWRDDNNGTLATTGTSAAFTVTSNQTEAALTDGYTVAVKFHATNDSSATLAVDGLAAKAIQFIAGTNIGAGAIPANTIQRLTYDSANTSWVVNGAGLGVPAGAVTAYAGSSAPGGWLLCDGTGYSRTTYANLFAAISTTYGSSDGSSFKVPDATGRTIFGKESSATRLTTAVGGVDGGTLGASGGAQSVTLTTAHLPNVSPTFTGTPQTFDLTSDVLISAGLQGATGASGAFQGNVSDVQVSVTPAGTISALGSGGAHANVPPGIVLNWIIKT